MVQSEWDTIIAAVTLTLHSISIVLRRSRPMIRFIAIWTNERGLLLSLGCISYSSGGRILSLTIVLKVLAQHDGIISPQVPVSQAT